MSQSVKVGGDQDTPILEFYPESGGLLNQLNFKTQEGGYINVLASVLDKNDLQNNPSFKNIPLFPFPNRLDAGRYEFEGKAYEFPINETELNNNLHGFAFDEVFHLENTEVSQDLVKTTLKLVYNGRFEYFPFPSLVELEFVVREQRMLEISAAVTNASDVAMPLGFGWHPYYTLNEQVDDLLLKLPRVKRKILNNRALPTGAEEEFQEFSKFTSIGDTFLDDCFELVELSEKASVRIWSKTKNIGLDIWQQAKDGEYSFLQVFTHPDRKRIAVEPMTCNVNAFHSGDGLKVLQPGERFHASFGVRLISSMDE